MIPAFVDALVQEIRFVAQNNPYQSVHAAYFGGGTPSQLQVEHFSRILAELRQQFNLIEDAEVTAEVNPNDIDTRYLTGLLQLGINRLSIGMQSANERELKLFARRHDFDTVVQAVHAAREAGFNNINLDLIYGFPFQTRETWEQTLQAALSLQPEHVSLYALGLEEHTPLFDWVQNKQVPSPDDDLAADLYELAGSSMKQQGYEQYEISNWSLPGFACRHNLQYWRNLPYLGLGPGAHGYAIGVRYETILSPGTYIQRMNHMGDNLPFPYTPAVTESIQDDIHIEMVDTLITNLRLTQEGIKRDAFLSRFGKDVMDIYGQVFGKFADQGLLSITPETVRVTEQGRLLSNLIFREIV